MLACGCHLVSLHLHDVLHYTPPPPFWKSRTRGEYRVPQQYSVWRHPFHAEGHRRWVENAGPCPRYCASSLSLSYHRVSEMRSLSACNEASYDVNTQLVRFWDEIKSWPFQAPLNLHIPLGSGKKMLHPQGGHLLRRSMCSIECHKGSSSYVLPNPSYWPQPLRNSQRCNNTSEQMYSIQTPGKGTHHAPKSADQIHRIVLAASFGDNAWFTRGDANNNVIRMYLSFVKTWLNSSGLFTCRHWRFH